MYCNALLQRSLIRVEWGLNYVHYVHGAERNKEKKLHSEGVRKSNGWAFLCFTKDVINPNVVYII